MKKIISISLILAFFIGLQAQNSTELMSLTKIQQGVKTKRISSYDRSGGNNDRVEHIAPGASLELCNIKGAGIINHIWITIAPPPEKLNRNNIILKMYWDGNDKPSVLSPIGPFFGQGWDEAYDFSSFPLSAGPDNGKGLVCYFAMPFEKGARIEIENQNSIEISAFYYYIDYIEMKTLPENTGRFHAWYNHETTKPLPEGENEWGTLDNKEVSTLNNPTGKDNYLFADITGKGQFVGVNYYINSPTPMWYGEGDDMIFIDGSDMPTLNGTGTEDYFNTSWCPKDIFSHPYYGYARVNNNIGWLGRTHVYRFHIADPIYFDKSLRFTIEHAHNNALTLDLASVAYWYQSTASGVPDIPSAFERTPKALIGPSDIHKWRHEWRLSRGNSTELWGNEKIIMPDAVPAWQILGPFDSPKNNNAFSQPLLPDNEVNLEKTYTGKNNIKISWREIVVGQTGYVDFDGMFNHPDYAAAYAYTKVWAPEDKSYTLKTGSDDGNIIWINSTEVFRIDTVRGPIPDENEISVNLRKGWNDVLIMVNDATAGWGFYFRFIDPDKELKYSLTTD